MEFPDSYFEDEVRDGFYIPSLMKRCWAAQMEMLCHVQQICERHKIRYFADWGTLLGAVRHGGMIPWDDDIDLSMPREDYARFREAADAELPDGCWFKDWRCSDEVDSLLGRIVNSHVHVLEGSALEVYHGFPYVAGIDIYCLEDLPDHERESRVFWEELCFLYKLIRKLQDDRRKGRTIGDDELSYYCGRIEDFYQVKLDRKKPLRRQLCEILEQKAALRYQREDALTVNSLVQWKKIFIDRYPKRCFERVVQMPFEGMEIAVPAGYDKLLAMEYGPNWMYPLRDDGGHEYPYYKKQQAYLSETNAGALFTYVYSGQEREEMRMLREEERARAGERMKEREKMLEEEFKKFLPLFREAHGQIARLVKAGKMSMARELLSDCQNAAIQLGTKIEEMGKCPGGSRPAVKLLEDYCEWIYGLYEELSRESANAFRDLEREFAAWEKELLQAADSGAVYVLNRNSNRKSVVFVPYKPAYWNTMAGIWREAEDDPDTDVWVIPAPYYYKDAQGKAKSEEMHYETEYPDDVAVTSYEEYPFDMCQPDVIVIQCPYDEYNYGLTIHPFFYAKNLGKYTDRLVCVPPFWMDEIAPGDEKAKENLRSLCCMPGVVLSDTVVVQSEQMRLVYVDILTEFAGADTRPVWERAVIGGGKEKDRNIITDWF